MIRRERDLAARRRVVCTILCFSPLHMLITIIITTTIITIIIAVVVIIARSAMHNFLDA